MRLFFLFLISIVVFSCKKTYDAPVPDWKNWDLFSSAGSLPLKKTSFLSMEGVYDLSGPTSDFGNQVAVKSSYEINKNDTTWHVSFLCGPGISYFVCEGRQLNGDILLNGYWRKMVNTETGIVRLTIKAATGGSLLLGPNPILTHGSVKIEGVYGNGDALPDKSLVFTYNRPLNHSAFQVLAHRAGGRTSDLLPVSENSVAMILKTPEFGSTGVEIDVRLTRDDSIVLYHDNTLNLREIQKSGLLGPIENYSYAELFNFVRLIHGERIPTLRQAMDAILYQTPLTFVYLDTKFTDPMQQLHSIQAEYLAKAAAIGRHLQIVIGLPTQDQIDQFKQLPNYTSIPSLCELTVDDTRLLNSKVWAPRWTLGTQNDLVDQMHAEGRSVFVWTMDVPAFIDEYIRDGHFDGILTNYPSYVAYAHYVQP